jgi:prepilin-type N-terminal cleavage/methylation domain-containing protein
MPTPRPRHPTRPRAALQGFTLIELVTVLLLVAILAAVAVPRLDMGRGITQAAWRDQVLAALLHARALAQGHRRLVCVTVATGEVRLTMASANPATSCATTVAGNDGDARWSHDGQGLAITVTPAGTLYFQPDGRITSDGAGATALNATIAISGLASLAVVGETGHVQ